MPALQPLLPVWEEARTKPNCWCFASASSVGCLPEHCMQLLCCLWHFKTGNTVKVHLSLLGGCLSLSDPPCSTETDLWSSHRHGDSHACFPPDYLTSGDLVLLESWRILGTGDLSSLHLWHICVQPGILLLTRNHSRLDLPSQTQVSLALLLCLMPGNPDCAGKS